MFHMFKFDGRKKDAMPATNPFLEDAVKGFTEDQDKLLPPSETVHRVKEKLTSAGLQLLEETVRIDTGRLGIPVFFSICGHDAAAVTGTRKQMGKGATPEQAEASAVMELVERFSFFSFMKNPENFTLGCHDDFGGDALPFSHIAKSVHDESDDLEVDHAFFRSLPMKWAKAYNLTRETFCRIPFDWFYAINAFNGPSAGNCREEAICQGICEVVERHVSALVSRNALPVPTLSTRGVTDTKVLEMIAKYERIGVRLVLSDFTLDMGIPSVGVLAVDPETFPEKSEIVWTAGTTPNPQKALSRALTETAQLAGDFNTSSNYVASGLPKPRSLREVAYISDPPGTVDISRLPDLSDPNLKVEVLRCVEALSKKGLDVFIIDVTHPVLQIPAFYTIIPGAHFRERAAGGSVGMFYAKLLTENHPPQRAIVELERMAGKRPDKHYIPFYLGSCHLSLNDPQTALGYFQRALDLAAGEEDLASICAFMGVCLKDLGRFKEAIDVLERGLAYDAERTDLHNLLGFCHFKLKAHETAIRHFKEVIRLDPASAIDYANIASNYRDMEDYPRALRYYEMALALDPSIEFARTNLERLKAKMGPPAGKA